VDHPPEPRQALHPLLTVAALLVVGAGLRETAPVVVPLLLALFLAIVASAPIDRLGSWGLPVPAAIAIVAGGILLAAALFSLAVAVSVGELSQSLPEYQSRVEAMADSVTAFAASHGFSFGSDDLRRLVDPTALFDLLRQFLTELGALLGNGVMVGFLVILVLIEATSLPTKLAAMTRDPEGATERLLRLRKQVDDYFGVLTIVSAGTGAAAFVLLSVLGVDLALLWGLLTFLFNFVPNIGSIVAAGPPVLLALVQLGPGSAAAVVLGYLAINMVIGNIIQPRLMGRDVGLSTLTVFVSLILWGWLLGPVGMLVSVPLTSAIRLALAESPSTRPIAVLLGTEEAALELVELKNPNGEPQDQA
jgi:predicted PurR-regulated permease PerM